MKTSKSNTGSSHSAASYTTSVSGKKELQSSQLMELFEDELKDIYWAEKALTKAIPKMIKKATSEKLVKALTTHLEETKEHVTRVEKVFETFGKKASAVKCDAMEGLIDEAEGIMEECEKGAMCDAGIISAAQKIEHYEIASYGTLRQFAETLKLTEAVTLLEDTLEEEKASDSLLTEVAVSAVNKQAATEKA
ncbi:hypothetical protein P872_04820 [Rhodonellum psychrophilum GCM71 = DSM 17998]|uniref:Uncharacterized protein n=2 Tax=Rhodonellum TaxID=336827 RepID=U5BYM4_9BACT|nr:MULTISPECIES: ferritin-like domain-containing protein [Rhodonellum]ERM82938.1 hypothetical protein P872_04820 [Rhodonellum psychrophilum GCM71 = DSM 17998]MDO9553008.1 ferritin-like domain-containing protein [Rhodonellum sp.]SDZ36820.1 Ferritin-like metal-binding protein YciE [Rhodonellum ikkaensis]